MAVKRRFERSKGEERMSDSIETLLVRNLHEVFGERDPARRTAGIEAILDRDSLFSDPHSRHMGTAGWKMRLPPSRRSPRTVFSQIGGVDALQDSGRLAWAFGPAARTAPDHRTVVVVKAGRISTLYTFPDRTGV